MLHLFKGRWEEKSGRIFSKIYLEDKTVFNQLSAYFGFQKHAPPNLEV